MNGKILVPSSNVKVGDFLGFVEYFFLKLPTTFPLYGPKSKIDEEYYV